MEEDAKYLVTSTKSLPIVANRAQGSFVEDVDGNVFLDFSTGISVLNLGHLHPLVVDRVEKQLHKLWHFAGTDFYYQEQVDAAKTLVEIAMTELDMACVTATSATEIIKARYSSTKINGRIGMRAPMI